MWMLGCLFIFISGYRDVENYILVVFGGAFLIALHNFYLLYAQKVGGPLFYIYATLMHIQDRKPERNIV